MKNRTRAICLLFVFIGLFSVYAEGASASDLMIASFENNGHSDLGTDIGTWSSNPLDTSQGCTIELLSLYGVMGKGSEESRVMKVTYDVSTNGPAFNGFYIKLNDMDLTPYNSIAFLIKGDPARGFTTKFRIEIKNEKGERATYDLSGITDDWKMISIPLQEARNPGSVTDWTCMSEMVFTFDDMTCDNKEGVLYIDNVMVSSKE
jgi:hypothetical protein